MPDRFNLYDLLGYLIPGGVLVSVVVFSSTYSGAGTESAASFSGSVLLVFASYVAGHFIQTVSRRLLPTPHYSIELMGAGAGAFPREFGERLSAALSERFGFPDAGGELTSALVQERFRLAYAFVVQRGLSGHALVFNSLYAMYRGLILGCALSLLVLSFAGPPASDSGTSWQELVFWVVAAALAVALTPLNFLLEFLTGPPRRSGGVSAPATQPWYSRLGRSLSDSLPLGRRPYSLPSPRQPEEQVGHSPDVSFRRLLSWLLGFARGWLLRTPFGSRYIEFAKRFAEEVYRSFYCADKPGLPESTSRSEPS